MRQDVNAEAAGIQFSARFSRQLVAALAVGALLLAAALGAAWWMARQRDAMLRDATGAMVDTGIEAFVEAARTSMLDYAVWDDGYARISAGDVDWMTGNIGASIPIGTYQMALVMRPDAPPLGFAAGGMPQAASAVIEPQVLDAVNALLDGVPIGIRAVATSFARSGGEVWLLTVARVVPQTDALPADVTDAAIPRLAFGFRVNEKLMGDLGRLQMLHDLSLSAGRPAPGRDGRTLLGPDGQPVAWLTWIPPMPGHAVLHAFLGPLTALVIALGVVAVLVLRELVRSARSLEAAVARAHAADQIKTEFLSNVSHELRTPLGGIIGLAQLLQMHDLDGEAREMVDLLLASAHTQLHMVNGLLDVARIETGTMSLASAPFEPAAIVEETTRLAAPAIAAKGLKLSVTIAPGVRRPVMGDGHAFRQIVSNLISNAAKFTDRGRIDVRLEPAPAGIDLIIADTGIGIAPADHRRIFERFVQVDGSSARRAGGAGLGLAITAALVELMGGAIRLDSVPEAGTTFTVSLPLRDVPAADAA